MPPLAPDTQRSPSCVRIQVKNETRLLVAVFVLFEILLAGDFCIIIQQSSSEWGFWVFAGCLAIIASIVSTELSEDDVYSEAVNFDINATLPLFQVTCIYIIVCAINFNKGLKPHSKSYSPSTFSLLLWVLTPPLFSGS